MREKSGKAMMDEVTDEGDTERERCEGGTRSDSFPCHRGGREAERGEGVKAIRVDEVREGGREAISSRAGGVEE